MKRSDKIAVFYTPEQVLHQNISKSYSKSPLKPMLLMKKFDEIGISNHFEIKPFSPYKKEEFLIAHTQEYVDAMFDGVSPLCNSNSVPWSPELVKTVTYTNASLYNAILHSIQHPEQVSYSPTSGFHHAMPSRGCGFCTFAGQVIASVKIYRATGHKGCYLDLDGHFGNSIEDCRSFVPDLNAAVPIHFNINPSGTNETYVNNLKGHLHRLEQAILSGSIDYVVWCHGADSHEWDDLGGQVSTKHWIACADFFYKWVKEIDAKLADLGRGPLPVTMSLFGGYRKNSYDSVLSLHTKDLVLCLNTLCGHEIQYEARVLPIGYTDEEYEKEVRNLNRMTPNEQAIIDFLKNQQDGKYFSGPYLGLLVKQWKNHSMGKWAKKLVKKGILESARQGYRLKSKSN